MRTHYSDLGSIGGIVGDAGGGDRPQAAAELRDSGAQKLMGSIKTKTLQRDYICAVSFWPQNVAIYEGHLRQGVLALDRGVQAWVLASNGAIGYGDPSSASGLGDTGNVFAGIAGAARLWVASRGKLVCVATKIIRTSGHDHDGPGQVQTHFTRFHTTAGAHGA